MAELVNEGRSQGAATSSANTLPSDSSSSTDSEANSVVCGRMTRRASSNAIHDPTPLLVGTGATDAESAAGARRVGFLRRVAVRACSRSSIHRQAQPVALEPEFPAAPAGPT